MTALLFRQLFRVIGYTLALMIILAFPAEIHAAEVFYPGTYVNSANGDQYIVSGSTERSGRTLWTVVGVHNSSNYFSAIWETGPALGNSLLAGTSNIVSYPNGYGPGRSYGVVGSTSFYGWDHGDFIAVASSGTTISISNIYSNGSTWDQFTLKPVSTGTLNSTSEDYVSGVYRDFHGYGYLVSGAASQPSGRKIWTIISLPDNPHKFNASWETGSAVGNKLLAGSSNVSSYSAGYAAGRSYGVLGSTDFYGWDGGDFIAAVRAGDTISLSRLNYNGTTWDQMVLIKEKSTLVSYGTGSENFSPGYYRSPEGKRYRVSGSSEANGRKFWTIASVSMPTTFNACWETGAAVGNRLLAGKSDISSYPNGYLAGRSYGVLGSTDFYGWDNGGVIAVIQTGNTITLSRLGYNGSTYDLFVLTKEPGTDLLIGSGTEIFLAATNYKDVKGNTYVVSGVADGIWSISGANGLNFNAQWQTGPAIYNTLLAGSSYISDYPKGYLAGRSYGVLGSTGFYGWDRGDFIAAAQAGDTISLSKLNSNGTTWDQFVVSRGGTGGIGGAGKISFSSPIYYVNGFDEKAVIGVTRSNGAAGMITAMYSTADGTAHSVTDYVQMTSGMLAWGDGDTDTKYIEIDIPSTAHNKTSFTITLSNPLGGATLGPQKTAIVAIVNTASYFLSMSPDFLKPTVTLSTTAPNPTSTSPIPVTITVSEDVTRLTIDDVVVTNGAPSDFTGSKRSYTVKVNPYANGLVTIKVRGGAAVSASGHTSAMSNVLTRNYDNIRPTVTLSTTAPNPTSTSPIPVTFTFSEPVSGFTVGDLAVTNGTLSNFSGSGKSYSVKVTPTAAGVVSIRVRASAAQDAAGNLNTLSALLSRTYSGKVGG